MTDFAKVIATLSKLSKAPLALKTITPGFPPDSFRSAGKYDDEEIYMHLEHFANENCIEDNQLEDVYDVVNAEDPEEIYEEMCKVVVVVVVVLRGFWMLGFWLMGGGDVVV